MKPVIQAKPGHRLAAFGCGLALCVIVLGAFTRLVDAGLGCPDWPVCYGHVLWPMEAHEVAAANASFPDTPVEHDKTWPEQVHRIAASSLGLVCIALVVIAFRHRNRGGQPLKLPIFLLGLVILQGLFGMWTVTLKLWPQVVTAHLLGGFATLSSLMLLYYRLAGYRWLVASSQLQELRRLRPLAIAALLVAIGQIALGGWTSSNYAALACPDLPTCQGAWLPPMNFAEGFDIGQHIGPNYLGGVMDNAARTAIHFSHRIGAVLVSGILLVLAVMLRGTAVFEAKRWATLLLSTLVLQLILGLSNIVWALPLPVAVAHNAVGAALLLVLIGLCHRLFTAAPESRPL